MRNWKGNPDKPLVSICSITYNHEKYISEALDSFLIQETDFPFEIVVDDDCSTDSTADIIRQYIEKYPTIIKANLRKINVGPMSNYIDNLKRAKGKYIAICEGDDYWIDPFKIKKQVYFLENNLDFVGISYNAIRQYVDTEKDPEIHVKISENVRDYEQKDFIFSSPLISLTVMIRNRHMNGLPNIMKQYKLGDLQLYLYLSGFGKFRFINEVVGTYRFHKCSLFSQFRGKKNRIKLIEEHLRIAYGWKSYLKQHKTEVDKYICRAEEELAIEYLKKFDLINSTRLAKKVCYKYTNNKKRKIIFYLLNIFKNNCIKDIDCINDKLES